MDYETLDKLTRSRKNLLAILADRGYTITPFEKFGPVEIYAMASAGGPALRMDLERSADAAAAENSTITKCRVVYAFNRIKNRLPSFLNELLDEDNEDAVDPKTTEVITMVCDPAEQLQFGEAFHLAAVSSLANRKLHIFFFTLSQLGIDPRKHELVPPHNRVPQTEVKDLMSKLKIKSKLQLPRIFYHEDMQARCMSLMPGEVIRIDRPSPTAGIYTEYRVCVP